jgi:hypothetical protein
VQPLAFLAITVRLFRLRDLLAGPADGIDGFCPARRCWGSATGADMGGRSCGPEFNVIGGSIAAN